MWMQDKNEPSKNQKRYYWLKLPKSYFCRLDQKKMRKQEHGKDMQIVYLRMMLLGVDKGGYIYYQGVYDSLEEELAEEFDEPVEIIRETLDYLKENNMISIDENSDCFVPEALDLTGSEGASTKRVRRYRENKKALQCNSDVTACNTEKELNINKYIKTDIREEKEKSDYQRIADLYNETCVSFPCLQKLSDARKKAIRARLKQYSIEDFERLFRMAEASSFLKGKNSRDWSASFDWLIKDANMAKVLDGNYQDQQLGNWKPNPPQETEAGESLLDAAIERLVLPDDVPFK